METYIPSTSGRPVQISPSKSQINKLRESLAHLREENQNYQKEIRILNQSITSISADSEKLELAIAERLKEIERLKRNNKLSASELEIAQKNINREKTDCEDSEKSYNEIKEDKRSVTYLSHRLDIFREMSLNFITSKGKMEKLKEIQKYELLFHRLIRINKDLTGQAKILLNIDLPSNNSRSPSTMRTTSRLCDTTNIDNFSRLSSPRDSTNMYKRRSNSNVYMGLLTGLGQKLKQNYKVIQSLPQDQHLSASFTSHSSLRPSYFNQDNNSMSPRSHSTFGTHLFNCNEVIDDDFNFGINDERYTKRNIDKIIRDLDRELKLNYDFRDLKVLIERFERFKEGNQKRAIARAKKKKLQLKMAGKASDLSIKENEIDNDHVHDELNESDSDDKNENQVKTETKVETKPKILIKTAPSNASAQNESAKNETNKKIRFSPSVNNSNPKPIKKQLTKRSAAKIEKDRPATIIDDCRQILENLTSKPPPDSNRPPDMNTSNYDDDDDSININQIVSSIKKTISKTSPQRDEENADDEAEEFRLPVIEEEEEDVSDEADNKPQFNNNNNNNFKTTGGASLRNRLNNARTTPYKTQTLNIDDDSDDDSQPLYVPKPPSEAKQSIKVTSPKNFPKTEYKYQLKNNNDYEDEEEDDDADDKQAYPGYNHLKTGGIFDFTHYHRKNNMIKRISRASLIQKVGNLQCQVDQLQTEIQMLEDDIRLNEFERGMEADQRKAQLAEEAMRQKMERERRRKNMTHTIAPNVDNYYIDMKRKGVNFNQFKQEQNSRAYNGKNIAKDDFNDRDYYMNYVTYAKNDAATDFDFKTTQTSVNKKDIEKIEKIQELRAVFNNLTQENERLKSKYEAERKKSKSATYIEVVNKLQNSIENRKQTMNDETLKSIQNQQILDQLQVKLNDEISKNDLIRDETNRLLQRPKQSPTKMSRTISNLKWAEAAIKRKINSLRFEEECIDSKINEISQICEGDEIFNSKQEINSLKNSFRRRNIEDLTSVVEYGEIERLKKTLDSLHNKYLQLKQTEIDLDSKINCDLNVLNDLYRTAKTMPLSYFQNGPTSGSSLSINSNTNSFNEASNSNNLVFTPPTASQFEQQNYLMNFIDF